MNISIVPCHISEQNYNSGRLSRRSSECQCTAQLVKVVFTNDNGEKEVREYPVAELQFDQKKNFGKNIPQQILPDEKLDEEELIALEELSQEEELIDEEDKPEQAKRNRNNRSNNRRRSSGNRRNEYPNNRERGSNNTRERNGNSNRDHGGSNKPRI